MMDGQTWAESEPGKGSTFHFTAWLGKTKEAVQNRVTPAILAGKSVLIVDDHPGSRQILEQMLRSADMVVTSLDSGIQCGRNLVECRKGWSAI